MLVNLGALWGDHLEEVLGMKQERLLWILRISWKISMGLVNNYIMEIWKKNNNKERD